MVVNFCRLSVILTKKKRKKMQDEQLVLSDVFKATVLSLTAKTIVHPLERVRIIAETTQNKSFSTSPLKMLDQYYSKQGLLFLLRGAEWQVPKFLLQQILTYMCKGKIKAIFPPFHPKKQFLPFFLVSIAQGVVWDTFKSVFLHPLETVQAKMMIDTTTSSTNTYWQDTYACVKQTLDNGTFYNGFEMNILSSLVSRTTSLVLYEYLHLADCQEQRAKHLSLSFVVFCLREAIVYPLELARKQAQVASQGTSGMQRLQALRTQATSEQLLEGAVWHVCAAGMGALLWRVYDYCATKFSPQ